MADSIFDVIGTPQERQEKVLRRALQARIDAWDRRQPDGLPYAYEGGADLLLRHGGFYTGRELPEAYLEHKGVPGRCFLNALEAAQADPTLRYCEGVYAIGDSHYTPHAWCLDPDGNLLEVSLSTKPDEIAKGVRSLDGRLPMLGIEHWGYYGAVFHVEFVAEVFKAQDAAGLLDRPRADSLDGNPHTMEWREDWHVLKLPYDPARRTL